MPHREHEPCPPDYAVYLAAYEHAWRQYQDQPTARSLALLLAGQELLNRELGKPGRLELGQIVATPGSLTAMEHAGHIPPEFLLRHKHGDWGELDADDVRANEQALRHGQRLLSAYHTRLAEKLWVITEWDRSVTTLLLPEEY